MYRVDQNLAESAPGQVELRYPELRMLLNPRASAHFVQFYERDAAIIKNISSMVEYCLGSGNSSILIATPGHVRAIEHQLARAGLQLSEHRREGRYIALDAADTLAQFFVNGEIDKEKCELLIGGILSDAIERSAAGFAFALGEMVALLCASGSNAAALRLEQIWNSLAQRHHFSLCCTYPLSSFGAPPDLDTLFKICAEHTLTLPAENIFQL
jgi:hypothetical protein